MKHILIYTTPMCGFCKMAKAFFDEHKIAYEQRDVSTDIAAADEMIQKSGQYGVPVIVVTGEDGKEEVVVGFDKQKFAKALGISA